MATKKTRSMKIQGTKSYRIFHRHEGENRTLNIKKHKKLVESMKLYGFLKSFPVVCYRDKEGKLVVKDGQHRLAIAEELGLIVYYIEEEVDFDVAVVNSTPKPWVLRDYAEKHAFNGRKDYQDGLDFADEHRLPLGTAFALLAGTTTFGNSQAAFIDGTFKVRDRKWANAVAGIFGPIVKLNHALNNARFVEACMAICRVDGFDAARLISGAKRCREKLEPYSTKEAYLEMCEGLYNFGRKQLVGLKTQAVMAMRERTPIKPGKRHATSKATGPQEAGETATSEAA